MSDGESEPFAPGMTSRRVAAEDSASAGRIKWPDIAAGKVAIHPRQRSSCTRVDQGWEREGGIGGLERVVAESKKVRRSRTVKS